MPKPSHAISGDGTRIAYEESGAGSPVLLIGGAFCDRGAMAALAALLAPDHRVVTYDRRGRGDSEATPVVATDEAAAAAEIADMDAVIRAASVSDDDAWHVFGHSSGAVLALRAVTEAAERGRIARVTAYEPTWIVPGTRPVPDAGYREEVRRAVLAGDRDGAAALFLEHSVLVPPAQIEHMRTTPAWAGMTQVASTLVNDLALHTAGWSVPAVAPVRGPKVTVLAGGESPEWLRASAQAAADAFHAVHATVDGQDHNILWQPAALVPYFADERVAG